MAGSKLTCYFVNNKTTVKVNKKTRVCQSQMSLLDIKVLIFCWSGAHQLLKMLE